MANMRISASMTLREQRLAAFAVTAAMASCVALIAILKSSDAREREFVCETNAKTAEGLSKSSEPELLFLREKLSRNEHAAAVIGEAISIKINTE